MDTSARERILDRVRQALATPSPTPHWAHDHDDAGPAFPLPLDSNEDRRTRFRREFEAIQGEWLEAQDIASAKSELGRWKQNCNVRSMLVPDSTAMRALLGDDPDVRWVSSESTERKGWDLCDAGITLCESLIAESGSICVSAVRTGRLPSVLPPIHLVIADEDQLVADIETSMQRLRDRYQGELPSSMSWITGPSRTADIEKILVLGAHGPRRLFLLMLPAGTVAHWESSSS